jgi:hypothetical protein
MDSLGLGYRYEYEGYALADGLAYLPDFYIPAWETILEIKPELPDDAAQTKANALARQSRRQVYMLIGSPWPGEYDGWAWQAPYGAIVGLRWSACRRCWDFPRLVVPLGAFPPESYEDERFCLCRSAPKDDHVVLQAAFLAARSARFEFNR